MPVQTRRRARNARAAGPVIPQEYPPIRDIPRDLLDTDVVYAIRRHDLLKLETMIQQRPDLVNKEFAYKEPNASDITNAYLLYVAVIENSLPIVKFLINKGANINLGASNGSSSPLYGASKYSHLTIAQYLIEHGADVNKVNNMGSTPLYMASYKGNLEIARFLVDNGADVNKANNEGYTPLYAASLNENLEVVQLLIAHGADINKASRDGGWVPLHTASHKGYLEIVRTLIDSGADIHKASNEGGTSLYYASLEGRLEVAQLLIERGADVNKAKNNGNTPLYEAANKGYLNLVKLLVEHGATITKKIINIAKTPEISDYLITKSKENIPLWKGITKGDLEKFNSIFDSENPSAMSNVSVCPVCLKYVERSEACNYMSHNCSTAGYYHDELYNKYKNASGVINWCTICGRICKGHNHYPLTSANGPVPEVIIGRDPFAPDCSVDGGGGIEEKIMRFRSMHEYAKRLQLEVGKITHEDAMNELVEAMWMPAHMPRIARNIIERKKFNINISNIPNAIERTGIVAAPADSYAAPTIAEHGTNMFTLEDDVPVIKFTHKNRAGTMVAHDESQAISKDMLIDFIKGSATTMNRCYVPGCGGYLWPEEIEAAFEMEPIKSSLTDSDRTTLAVYKERFYPVYNAIGGQSQNVFQPALNAIYAMPVKKRGGRRVTRKRKALKAHGNKSRHGRRLRWRV